MSSVPTRLDAVTVLAQHCACEIMVLLPLILALLALSSVHAQQDASGATTEAAPSTTYQYGDGDGDAGGINLDSLIRDVFLPTKDIDVDPNKGSSTPIPGVGGECQCVPFYQCFNNYTIKTDGFGLLDIRGSTGSKCANYMEKCCEKPNIFNATKEESREISVAPSECGKRNSDGVGFRITGDDNEEAQFAEFPWMVAVLRVERDDADGNPKSIYLCGGSLINHQVVMTAAHCVARKIAEDLTIRAGEWDTQMKMELYPYQDRHVSKIVVHEGYYAGALYNDIALLILDSPVDHEENIGTVCLPDQGENMDQRRCFASGWGKDVYGKEGTYQVILKKIELPVVSRTNCLKALRETRLGRSFRLHSSFLCAGGEPNRDTCKGDGGSPLVCPFKADRHHYVQSGIVAWGIGCGVNNTPGVYVNVAQFRTWIDNKMANLHLDSSSYRRAN